MHQPDLDAPTSEGSGRDSFATLRAEHPDARLVRFHDQSRGYSFVMAVPPSSPWYALFPPQQDVHVKRRNPGDEPHA